LYDLLETDYIFILLNKAIKRLETLTSFCLILKHWNSLFGFLESSAD